MAVDCSSLKIETMEMHTGGEPLRIVASGYPPIVGTTVLEKRAYVRKKLDNLRKFLMWEPRGHRDMYGALLVKSPETEAHFGVIFMHNEGYSTMCGHAVIALARYFVDKRPLIEGEATQAPIQISSFQRQVFSLVAPDIMRLYCKLDEKESYKMDTVFHTVRRSY